MGGIQGGAEPYDVIARCGLGSLTSRAVFAPLYLCIALPFPSIPSAAVCSSGVYAAPICCLPRRPTNRSGHDTGAVAVLGAWLPAWRTSWHRRMHRPRNVACASTAIYPQEILLSRLLRRSRHSFYHTSMSRISSDLSEKATAPAQHISRAATDEERGCVRKQRRRIIADAARAAPPSLSHTVRPPTRGLLRTSMPARATTQHTSLPTIMRRTRRRRSGTVCGGRAGGRSAGARA